MNASDKRFKGGNIVTLVSFIKAKIDTLLANKVDVESGKGLSTNDYTTGDKNKVGLINGRTDNSSATAFSSTNTNFPTVRTIYYGLPNINDSHSYTSSTNVYSPTSVGSNGQILKSSGSGAPSWQTPSSLTLTLNGTGNAYTALAGGSKSWYAPTTVGTAGHELISNGSGAPIWKGPNYATCTTAANIAAKTVEISNFKLVTGAKVVVHFTTSNSVYSNVTLNVSSTGAKPLVYSSYFDSIDSSDYSIGNGIYEMLYDGTRWIVVNDYGMIEYYGKIRDVSMRVYDADIDGGLNACRYTYNNYYQEFEFCAGMDYRGSYLMRNGYNVLYADNSNIISNDTVTWYAPISVGSSGQVLRSSGSGNPSWMSPSSLTLYLNGSGTSYSTFSGGSKTWYAPTLSGASGYELISNGSGEPLWKAPSYASCTTAAATAAKTASISNFRLATGVRVAIKFSYANTIASPTLNISSTGAKSIKWGQTVSTVSNDMWLAGDVVEFVYDGSYWVATSSSRGIGGYFYGNVRIKGSGNYGGKINFGNGEYCYVYEETDNTLKIHGTRMDIDATAIALGTTTSQAVFLRGSRTTATTPKVMGMDYHASSSSATSSYNSIVHVSPVQPSDMAVGDLWFKIS